MRTLLPLAASLALAAGGAACSKADAPAAKTDATPDAKDPGGASDAAPVTFVLDDWAGAKATAAAAGKLLFVDASAEWCHTCLSMEREVLNAPALGPQNAHYVFARLDTDRPENAAFTARYPVRVWPTFFVLDPQSDAIVATHGGSLSLPELLSFLDESRRAARSDGPADVALAKGYAALAARDPAAAAGFFVSAAAHGGARQSEAVHAAVRAAKDAKDPEACVDVALAYLDTLQGSAAPGDLAGWLLSCAESLPDDSEKKQQATQRAEARLTALLSVPPAGASIDDRADVMRMVAELKDERGDKDGARVVHERRLALLEKDALDKASPAEARVQDYARMQSYLYLGRGDEAVKLFTERTQQLPTSYEAWARLASTLHQLGRHAEAKPVVERAVSLSYGPRRLRYLKLQADVLAALGDKAGAAAVLDRLIDENAALAEPVRLVDVAAAADARRNELRAP